MAGYDFDLPILIILHLILFCFLTYSKEKVFVFDKIGILWVSLIGLAIIRRVLHLNFETRILTYFINFIYYPLGYGPCLYLYVKYLIRPERFEKKDVIHFFPFIGFLFLPLLPNYEISVSLDSDNKNSFVVYLFVVLTSLSLVTYSLLTQRKLQEYNKQLLESFSYQSVGMTISWLTGFIFLYLFVIIVQFTILLTNEPREKSFFPQSLTTVLFFGYFYLVSYFLLRQQSLYRKKEKTILAKKEKYAKSGLTNKRMLDIQDKLLMFMKESRIYLQNDLNIEDVAKTLGVSSAHISQVLNQRIGKNFFLFVNEYRVAEVIKRLNDAKYAEYSILRIAYDTGFNSKSSFNAIFRKITGKTPNEYRDRNEPPDADDSFSERKDS